MLLCSTKTLAIRKLAFKTAEARRRCLLGQRRVRLRAARQRAAFSLPAASSPRADLAAAARRRTSCLLTTATETCPLPSRLHV
jgi:hypothetical protein